MLLIFIHYFAWKFAAPFTYNEEQSECVNGFGRWQKLYKLSVDLLPHPSHPLDLSRQDFYVFKENVKKNIWTNNEIITKDSEAYSETIDKSLYKKILNC